MCWLAILILVGLCFNLIKCMMITRNGLRCVDVWSRTTNGSCHIICASQCSQPAAWTSLASTQLVQRAIGIVHLLNVCCQCSVQVPEKCVCVVGWFQCNNSRYPFVRCNVDQARGYASKYRAKPEKWYPMLNYHVSVVAIILIMIDVVFLSVGTTWRQLSRMTVEMTSQRTQWNDGCNRVYLQVFSDTFLWEVVKEDNSRHASATRSSSHCWSPNCLGEGATFSFRSFYNPWLHLRCK